MEQNTKSNRWFPFPLVIDETILQIRIPGDSFTEDVYKAAHAYTRYLRNTVQEYCREYPLYKTSLQPCIQMKQAPPLPRAMLRAALQGGVGPMASVAGAIAQALMEYLIERYNLKEIVIDNGGDITFALEKPLLVGVYAGHSPFTNTFAIELQPRTGALCTSSRTVGHSLSLGRAQAFVVLGRGGALMDAQATAFANRVQEEEDVHTLVEAACQEEGIDGALGIMGNTMACAGEMVLKSLQMKDSLVGRCVL